MPKAAFLILLLGSLAEAAVMSPGHGIPETLATQRSANIRGLRYELAFRIPESKTEALRGTETIRFQLPAPMPVALDFEQKRERILSVKATKAAIRVRGRPHHACPPKPAKTPSASSSWPGTNR